LCKSSEHLSGRKHGAACDAQISAGGYWQTGFTPTELWDSVKRIRAPIIYILGGSSDIVPPETQMKLQEVLPQVEMVTMRRPGDEEPEAFLAIVDRFLAKIR
jgi:pimeloyl-ACP methyl ester carboxylesterase